MDSDPVHIPLYADEKTVIERVPEEDTTQWKRSPEQQLAHFYEIDRTLEWIHSNDFKKVALQFPDQLLADSATVASYIQQNATNGCRAYVLADTSYGKCCIDEVTAQHIFADSLIHYGQACLSSNSRLPILYVFGRQQWNTSQCASQLREEFGSSRKVVVLYDVQFHYGLMSLISELSSTNNNFTFATIRSSTNEGSDKADKPEDTSCPTCVSPDSSSGVVDYTAVEHHFCGRTFVLPSGSTLAEHEILYIGGEGALLTNVLMHYNQLTVWSYNPSGGELRRESVGVNRVLMKRFYMIEKAKDCDIFGIVVGTLAVSNYLDILAHLKKVIKGAGKKYYTFVMGKLNIAKLANFAEIDMFVLVACPENTLLDSKEFFRPIVTPFELEIALVRGKEWNSQYTTDFALVLRDKDVKTGLAELQQKDETGTEAEEIRISLISNKIRANHKANIAIEDELDEAASSSTQENVVAKRARMDVAVASGPTASTVFLQRTFQGLQQRLGEDAPHVATEGLSGIAAGYENEGSAQ